MLIVWVRLHYSDLSFCVLYQPEGGEVGFDSCPACGRFGDGVGTS